MRKGRPIVRYGPTELRALVARDGTRTDWAAVRRMTDEDVAPDPAFDGFDLSAAGLARAAAVLSDGRNKELISMRVDADVLAWYRAGGPGYQRRMMAALRAYMIAAKEARRRPGSKRSARRAA